MQDKLVFAALFGFIAIGVTFLHHNLEQRPHAVLRLDAIFYEQTGLQINVPDPKTTIAEFYDTYVIIKRKDGPITVVPLDRIHAVDGHAT